MLVLRYIYCKMNTFLSYVTVPICVMIYSTYIYGIGAGVSTEHVPILIDVLWFLKYIYRVWVLGYIYCKMNTFLSYVTVPASVFTLLAITIDRRKVRNGRAEGKDGHAKSPQFRKGIRFL